MTKGTKVQIRENMLGYTYTSFYEGMKDLGLKNPSLDRGKYLQSLSVNGDWVKGLTEQASRKIFIVLGSGIYDEVNIVGIEDEEGNQILIAHRALKEIKDLESISL